MLAVLKGSLCKIVVCPNGRHYSDCINVGRCDDISMVGGDGHVRVGLSYPLKCFVTVVTHRNNSGPLLAMKVSDDIGAPVPVADDSHSQSCALGAVLYQLIRDAGLRGVRHRFHLDSKPVSARN